MRIPNKLDEKLRKLLNLIEEPLETLKDDMQFWDIEFQDDILEADIIKALNLRKEIIELIDPPVVSGRYKQLDLEEEIKKIKKTKSEHENY